MPGDPGFVMIMLVQGKILIFPGLGFLTYKMELKTTILSISQDCREDQINSHVKETYGSEIADLPDLVRFHLAPHPNHLRRPEKALFHYYQEVPGSLVHDRLRLDNCSPPCAKPNLGWDCREFTDFAPCSDFIDSAPRCQIKQ